MSDDTTKRIMKVKEEVDDAKQTKSRLEGEIDSLFKRLKKEFKVSTIQEAKKKEKELVDEANKLEEEIETGLNKLEELYG